MVKKSNKPKSVDVFLERRKTKEFVGRLSRIRERGKTLFRFEYEFPYLLKQNSIPLGPEFPLTKRMFKSKKLFDTFEDRIPSKRNPAYREYCEETGIDPKESDVMVLLPAIGKRGPSSFVFEREGRESTPDANVTGYRKRLGLTIREFSTAFNISSATLQRIESGNPKATEAVRRVRIYAYFPEVALWEVEQNKAKLHWKAYEALKKALNLELEAKR